MNTIKLIMKKIPENKGSVESIFHDSSLMLKMFYPKELISKIASNIHIHALNIACGMRIAGVPCPKMTA